MNAIEIYERASWRLERGLITIGQFDKAVAVLKDVEPVVHAKWVAETERMGHYSHCSKCECRCQGYVPNYKFCPKCGAKMDGA